MDRSTIWITTNWWYHHKKIAQQMWMHIMVDILKKDIRRDTNFDVTDDKLWCHHWWQRWHHVLRVCYTYRSPMQIQTEGCLVPVSGNVDQQCLHAATAGFGGLGSTGPGDRFRNTYEIWSLIALMFDLSVKYASSVARCFEWNFKDIRWNAMQHISPIYWNLYVLHDIANLRNPQFKSTRHTLAGSTYMHCLL